MLFGTIAFREIKREGQRAVLGFWLTSETEGKGVASNACKKLIEYGENIGIKRFEIHTATGNIRSQRLAQKLFFKRQPGIVTSAEIINTKSLTATQ